MSTTAPASTRVDWSRVAIPSAIPSAVVFAKTPRFPAALRDATFSVVSVVFDDDENINAGQGYYGRGTLGLCPPPRNEVVPVVFPDSDESFSAMWATAPASGWPWAAGHGHGPVEAEGPTGADEAPRVAVVIGGRLVCDGDIAAAGFDPGAIRAARDALEPLVNGVDGVKGVGVNEVAHDADGVPGLVVVRPLLDTSTCLPAYVMAVAVDDLATAMGTTPAGAIDGFRDGFDMRLDIAVAGPAHAALITVVERAISPTGADEAPSLPEALRLLDLVGTDEDPYKDGGPWAYADAENCGGRVFFVTQNAMYGGRVLLSAETIEKALARKGFATGRWAWIKHDKDTYTADEAKKLPGAVAGATKADHFHIAIHRKSFATLGQVARAFGVPPNQVEIKPQGSFLDFVEYLTHENPGQQKKGKFLYADDEVFANFDWRPELDDHKLARSAKAGQRANSKKLDALMLAVLDGSKTLREVRAEESILYGRNVEKFRRWRQDFMTNRQPPSRRINYYIGGDSNSGKSIVAELLALGLYPDLDADELIFWAGDPRVAHQGYVGQQVVIYDDYRPGDLVRACGGRTGVWRVFDPHPKPADANVKNGAVRLLQEVNIITGVVPYREFMEQLAGSYTDERGNEHAAEDDRQSFRRFPFVIEVTPEMVEFYANRGFFGDNQRIREYERFARMKANMREVIGRLDALGSDDDKAAYRDAIGGRLFAGMVTRHRDAAAPAQALTVAQALAELEATTVVQTAAELAAEEAERERQRAAAEAARTARHDAHRAYHEADPTAPPSVCTFDHQEHACTWDPARAGFDPWRVPMPA